MSIDLRWFNASAPEVAVGSRLVWAWNLFNRRCANGDHYWGAGLLQIGGRHLAYIGHDQGCLLFVRLWTVLDHEAHGMTWRLGIIQIRDRHVLYVVQHRGAWGVLMPSLRETPR